MKENCPFCAGVDKEKIPINCIICRTNTKYLNKRELYFKDVNKDERLFEGK